MMLCGKLSGDLRHFFYEPPLYSHAYAIRRPPQRGRAPTLKSRPVAPADVCSGTRYRSASTAGRRTPAYTPFGLRYVFAASEKAPTTRRGGWWEWEVGEATRPTK
jgi:hypothetical protein